VVYFQGSRFLGNFHCVLQIFGLENPLNLLHLREAYCVPYVVPRLLVVEGEVWGEGVVVVEDVEALQGEGHDELVQAVPLRGAVVVGAAAKQQAACHIVELVASTADAHIARVEQVAVHPHVAVAEHALAGNNKLLHPVGQRLVLQSYNIPENPPPIPSKKNSTLLLLLKKWTRDGGNVMKKSYLRV